MSAITPIQPENTQNDEDDFALGKWCWVLENSHNGDSSEEEWLGCITEHGSNYVLLTGVGGRYNIPTIRVHVNDLYTKLRLEPEADRKIAARVGYHQQEVNNLLGRIKEETRKLGIAPKMTIADGTSGENALAVISEQVDTTAYKTSLIKAKDENLPALFKLVEEEHKRLAAWMQAPVLPLQAKIGPMKDCITDIEDRIYTVELYAGLTESSAKVKDGDPAMSETPLHVMQRLHYMDEECLLDYDHGGMEFKDIGAFDAWLSREHNFERLLPFQRCAVAFQVRRGKKVRYSDSFAQTWINLQLERQDKWTFLYVRNGEQLWRIGCDFEFGHKLFPDQSEFDPANGGYVMEVFGGTVRNIITRNEYEVGMAEYKKAYAKYEAERAEREASGDEDKSHFRLYAPRKPFENTIEPLDPSSVYYDDGMEKSGAAIKEFNRIGVILQGLFDRSLILHPHPPVSVWDNASFQRSVVLVYDATTLTYGDAPDFEAYFAKLGESIGVGSITIGQDQVWQEREAERENNRTRNNWREKVSYHELFIPSGDPGPGKIAQVAEWKPRARKAVFRWERRTRDWRNDDLKPCVLEAPAQALFNVSAYKPGDYLQFFRDPRTRQNYLKWAPLLLAAEEYHAGNYKLREEGYVPDYY